MKLKYELNLPLYELCVRLINHYRWQGLTGLDSVIDDYRKLGTISDEVINFIEYGTALVCNGRDPEIISFLMTDALYKIQSSVPDSYPLIHDLHLVTQFVKWLQNADTHSHQVLLDSMDDKVLRSKYKNWISLNEYKLSLSFDAFLLLDNAQISEIIQSNPLVKSHYESLIKGGLR